MADSKKYGGSQWEHSLRKLTTATEAVENPLYSDGTAITAYTIKGNTIQNGTPTPSNPVPVVGVGELETTGEHTGEYKIPISSGGVTTNIYLSEPLYKIGDYADTIAADGTVNRVIKRVILQGGEINYSSGNAPFRLILSTAGQPWDNANLITWCCSHYRAVANSESWTQYDNLISASKTEIASYGLVALRFRDTSKSTVEDFNTFLSVQYAAGTPVTVWYVLATPTTESFTAPSIPTTEGANSITVDTTVQPSEFTATWTGWHNANVKEWEGSQWQ